MEMLVYHGTSSIFRDNIEKNGLDPAYVRPRDDHWLGQGVYFYDNEMQARWWSAQSVKKDGGYKVVFKAQLNATDDLILNLDNPIQLREFVLFAEQLADEVSREDFNKGRRITKQQYRAIAFDYYKKINNICVIIATFSKEAPSYLPRLSDSQFEFQKKFLDTIDLGYKERQICVSSKEVLYDVEAIFDEENEVI